MSLYRIEGCCKWTAGCLLVFLYIFNISFTFLPGGVRSRMVIGGAGLLLFAARAIIHRCRINRHILCLVLLQGLYVLCNVFSCVLNGSSDLWFCQYAALNVVYLFGALWICRTFVRQFDSLDKMLGVIAGCIVFHNILAFVAFVEPSVREILSAMQNDAALEGINPGVRATGLGIGNFFYGGMISSFGEVALMYLIGRRKIRVLPGVTVLVIMAVTGIFIARTTMVGLLVGMLFFASRRGDIVRILVYMSLAASAVYLIYSRCLADTVNIKWAFEFLENYSASGEMETNSTNSLMEMYETLPEGTTWIWGDGRHDNPDGSFYMHTDVGYMRVIFGIGLLGLLCEFVNYYYVCKVMYLYSNHSRQVRTFAIIAMILYYVLFLKSQAQLYFFLYLCAGTLYYTSPMSIRQDLKTAAVCLKCR